MKYRVYYEITKVNFIEVEAKNPNLATAKAMMLLTQEKATSINPMVTEKVEEKQH